MDAMEESKGDETREEMLSRHRQEMRELRNKEMALKKAAAKGSKAEQKAKKKQVEDEISQLLSQLEDKHSKELSSFGYKDQNNAKGNLDNIVMAIASASITTEKETMKPSKGARRRERRVQEEAAREQRIQEEQSNIISDRMIENDLLEKKLEPLGLTINEIKPDGHCLYRAVENQLSLHSKNNSNYTYQELREMAAKYMREHSTDFLPFFLSDSKIEGESDCSPLERFERYCDEVESTSAWGGQLELGALTHCLKKHVVILSGSFPDVEMGKEYKSENGSDISNPSIMLSYHRHAYGLGEHYNSVVAIGIRGIRILTCAIKTECRTVMRFPSQRWVRIQVSGACKKSIFLFHICIIDFMFTKLKNMGNYFLAPFIALIVHTMQVTTVNLHWLLNTC